MTQPAARSSSDEQGTSQHVASAETTQLTLTIAGADFAIEVATPAMADALRQEYGPFIRPGHSDAPAVAIHVSQRLDPARLDSWTPSHPLPDLDAMGLGPHPLANTLALTRDDAFGFAMDVPYMTGSYNGTDRADIEIFIDDVYRGFEQFFATLFINVMLPRHCALLHASGVLHDGKAFLFSGPSNAGKTTVVENSPGRTVLSDELVAVSWDPETGQLWAHGTPFYGSWGQVGAPTSAPLHAVHFLRKDQRHQLERLSGGERFRRACQVICSISPNNDAITEHCLAWAERLLPYCRLFGFVPEPGLWDYLTQPHHIDKDLER